MCNILVDAFVTPWVLSLSGDAYHTGPSLSESRYRCNEDEWVESWRTTKVKMRVILYVGITLINTILRAYIN